MEVDGGAGKPMSKSAIKSKIEKRKISGRKASIVFPRFKEGKKGTRSSSRIPKTRK